MSPRPYRLGQREPAIEENRARILAAARDLLATSGSGFTVDAVARAAGVARVTVYYQFGAKLGLLKALFDDLAVRGGMGQLPAAFGQSDPLAGLMSYIEVFGRFWASDRAVLRRLRSLAALDPDFEESVRERDHWRRVGVRTLLERIAERYDRPSPDALAEATDVLYTLTSFESFDTLAGPDRSPEQVAPVVQRLALLAIGLAAGV